MGMSFATLSLYGAERSALEAALAPGDLLRDRNLPWLTLVRGIVRCAGRGRAARRSALRCHAARGKGAGVDAPETPQAVRSHGARGRKLAGGNEDHADNLPAAAAAMEAL